MALALLIQDTSLVPEAVDRVLRRHGVDAVQVVASAEQALPWLRERRVAVLLLPVDQTPDVPTRWAAILRTYPELLTVALAPRADAEVVLAALRAGIREFLVTPIVPEELDAALTRLRAGTRDRAGVRRGALLAVHAAKGGSGVSTIATSLAWAFAHMAGDGRRPGSRAVLADFTTIGIGVRGMLHMEPPHDLASLTEHTDGVDRALLRSVVFDHPEQLGILAAARDPADAHPPDPTRLTRILELLQAEYRQVIVDTDHHLASHTLGILEAADRILLITQRDLVSLRSTMRTLSLFGAVGLPDDRIHVIVNRVSSRDRIPTSQVSQVLGRPVFAEMPNDYAACEYAVTAGVFVAQNRRTPFAQAVMHLAARLGSPRDPAASTASTRAPLPSASTAPTGGRIGRLGAFFRRR